MIPTSTNIQPKVDPSTLPFERLAESNLVSEKQKVSEAARQFEAVLLRQILTEARKQVIKSNLHPTNATTEIYQGMINEQFADSLSRSGGLGIAHSLQLQLDRQNISERGRSASEVAPSTKSPAGAPVGKSISK